MNLENVIFVLGIIILMVTTIAIVFLIQTRQESRFSLKNRINSGQSGKPTYFLEEGEDEKKCEICYGSIDDEPLAECPCGRIFHEACAKPTGACPYCNAGCDAMTVREPVRIRCPECGRFVKKGVCVCGVILPRKDETILCSCGNRVDMSRPVCRKCGAAYERSTMQIYKRDK